MRKTRSIYFVGIKGVGMTPLALIAKTAGIQVSGSDVADQFITDQLLRDADIHVNVGFDPAHVKACDLVITTGAHGGYDNIEVQEAKKLGIPVLTKGEAVGAYMDGDILGRHFDGIAIAGTHGKTTTTAIIATILAYGRLDPSYIVGTGSIASLGKPGYLGKGRYFVVEADEYAIEPVHNKKPQFLCLNPKIAVFTNIELDHVDIYKNQKMVEEAFVQLGTQISDDGVLIACGDDHGVRTVLQSYNKRVITYGFSTNNDYVITRFSSSETQTFFRVHAKGVDLGEFVMQLAGEHNGLNALAGIITALEVGMPLEKIKKALKTYTGSKRRFERLGVLPSGAIVYDDYAHHPTEIKKTLHAFRQIYPKKQILCIFQPHTYSRTKQLFTDFLQAFSDADQVIITDIYTSKREAKDATISAKILTDEMKKFHKNVSYTAELDGVVEYIKQNRVRSDTVVVLMGAGDIYTVSEKLEITNES